MKDTKQMKYLMTLFIIYGAHATRKYSFCDAPVGIPCTPVYYPPIVHTWGFLLS